MSKSSQFFLNLFSLFLLFSCGCGKPKLHVNKVDKVDSVDVSDSEILKNKVSQAHKNLANVFENAIEGEATETQLKALESAIEDLVKVEEEKAILEVEAEAEIEAAEEGKVVEAIPAVTSSPKPVKKVTAVSRAKKATNIINARTKTLTALIPNLKTTLERNRGGNQQVKKAYLEYYVAYIEKAVDASVKAIKNVETDVKSVKQNQDKKKSAINELKKAVEDFEKAVGEVSNSFSNDNSFSTFKTKLAELKSKLTISSS